MSRIAAAQGLPGPTKGKLAIAVTGLPASGKSGLGREISRRLDLALLDKDDFLESLFDSEGCADESCRRQLSRRSDTLLRQAAARESAAVLVSHWRARATDSVSGTPVEWLTQSFERVVELYCECPVEIAAQRFATRRRHPGHQDRRRSAIEIETWFEIYAKCLPLSLGRLVTVASDREIDYATLCGTLRESTGACA